MKLRYIVYTAALFTAFQCGQVYKAHHSYQPGLPEIATTERAILPIEVASMPMNYYPPDYEPMDYEHD